MSDKHIFLIGFMGTGKSTVSRILQAKSGLTELDMDAEIVRENEMAIPVIFERFGEAHFRDLETGLLKRLAEEPAMLVSCGGGCVLRPENVEIMKQCGRIVLLTATPETVFQRVRFGKNRPILNGNMNVEYIEQLMEKRRRNYENASDLTVSTDNKTPDEIADEILDRISRG